MCPRLTWSRFCLRGSLSASLTMKTYACSEWRISDPSSVFSFRMIRTLGQRTTEHLTNPEDVHRFGIEPIDDRTSSPISLQFPRVAKSELCVTGLLSPLLTIKTSISSKWIRTGILPLLSTGPASCTKNLGLPYRRTGRPFQLPLTTSRVYLFSKLSIPNGAFSRCGILIL